jgi:Mn-dependent DtxR family transcriptional regulator
MERRLRKARVKGVMILNFRESSENYLKAILVLKQTQGDIRCIDLARYMGFSKASVSHAVAILIKDELLDREGNYLRLTIQGEKLSRQILEKHNFFIHLLIQCGVEPKLAEMEACKIEHVISNDTLHKIKETLQGRFISEKANRL